ncbi:uncharacterized protein LOC116165558 [Photinus pyralis]|uniref:uncharacterized protein LOC116165558 n=1 Tax=Photinus pyralis TaxID=7054 RepID=UPI001266F8E8|nr:uncharacterized protein LOC116165558 [Photinus pyralis]
MFPLPLLLMEFLWIQFVDYQRDVVRDVLHGKRHVTRWTPLLEQPGEATSSPRVQCILCWRMVILACKIFVTISYKKMKICSALSNTTLEQNIRVRQIFQLPLLLMECLWIHFFVYQRDAARDVDTSREKTGLKQYLPTLHR